MEDELRDAQRRVLQKIGRNLLLYQQLEQHLKSLLLRTNISGPASKLVESHGQRASVIHRHTMGQLVTSYLERVLAETGDEEDRRGAQELIETWLSLSITAGLDQAYIDRKRGILTDIVADRNNLAHHFLTLHSLATTTKCQDVEDILDQQSDRVRTEINEVEELIPNEVAPSANVRYAGTEQGRR
jgi:hypothetical protein